MHLKAVVQTTRPSFLLLAPLSVLFAVAVAIYHQESISIPNLGWLFLGALSALVSVNTFNEYCDFQSGLDFKTLKTPFSGGSGALPENPDAAKDTHWLAMVSLVTTMIVGYVLMQEVGFRLLPIGLLGIFLIITYTQWIVKMPWVCLIAPGLGFGLLIPIGSYMVISSDFAPLMWHLALIPFLLVNNLLLINQIPDIAADISVGRRTFPIVYGVAASGLVFLLFSLLAYFLIAYHVYRQCIPVLSLLAVLPMFASLYAYAGIRKYGEQIGHHPTHLAANVVAVITTPLLLMVGLIWG